MGQKCINCGISGVPLYIGLDGHLHCEKHVQILVGAGQYKENTEEMNYECKDKQSGN